MRDEDKDDDIDDDDDDLDERPGDAGDEASDDDAWTDADRDDEPRDGAAANVTGAAAAPSKSAAKRHAHALTDFGAVLVAMADSQLARIPLPEDIRAAVLETRRIRKHGARKRQLLYLGKLLRRSDVTPLLAAHAEISGEAKAENLRLHGVERWRDRLLAEGEAVIGELLEHYPEVDRQRLRQLLRTARREQAAQQPPAAARALFRLLRDTPRVTSSGTSESQAAYDEAHPEHPVR